MEPATLPEDAFFSRVEVFPNHSSGHELFAFIRSPGTEPDQFSFRELRDIPGAPALFLDYGIEYFICYGHRINEVLADCERAADLMDPQLYQLSTMPFVVPPRPWASILHTMLMQWRDGMNSNWHLPCLNLASVAYDVVTSNDSLPMLQLRQMCYSVISQWKTLWTAWHERAMTVDKRLRRFAGLQLRLDNLFFGFRAWYSIATGSSYDVVNWQWRGSWVLAYPLQDIIRKRSMPGESGKLQTVFKCRLRFGRSAYVPYRILNRVEGKAVKKFNAMVKDGADLPADSSSDEYGDNEDDFAQAINTVNEIIRDNSLSPNRSPAANAALMRSARQQAASAMAHGRQYVHSSNGLLNSGLPTENSNLSAGNLIPASQVKLMIEQAVSQALANNPTPTATPVFDTECANCFMLTPNDVLNCQSCGLPHARLATAEERKELQTRRRSERATATALENTQDPMHIPAIHREVSRRLTMLNREVSMPYQVQAQPANVSAPSHPRSYESFMPRHSTYVSNRVLDQASTPVRAFASPGVAIPHAPPIPSIKNHMDMSICRKCGTKARDMRDVLCWKCHADIAPMGVICHGCNHPIENIYDENNQLLTCALDIRCCHRCGTTQRRHLTDERARMEALTKEKLTKASLTNVITPATVAKGISASLVISPAQNRRFCSIRAGANNRQQLLFARCESSEAWLAAVIGCCNGCPGSFIMDQKPLPLVPNGRNFICIAKGFEFGNYKQQTGKFKDKNCSTCYSQEFIEQSDDGIEFDTIKFNTAALNVELQGYDYSSPNIWNVLQANYALIAFCIHHWLSDVFCIEWEAVYQGIGRRHNAESVPRVTYTPAACDNMVNGIAQYWSASNTSFQDHDEYFQDQYGDSARILHEGSSAARLKLWFEEYDVISRDFVCSPWFTRTYLDPDNRKLHRRNREMQQTVADQAQQLLSLTAAVAALSGNTAPTKLSKKEKKKLRFADELDSKAATSSAGSGDDADEPITNPNSGSPQTTAAAGVPYGPRWTDVLAHNRSRMLEGKKLQWPLPPDFASEWIDVKGSDLVCLKCNSSKGGHHNTLHCTNPQSPHAFVHKNSSNTVGWNLRAVARWVKELSAPGCHWSEKESADRYHALNIETPTSGPPDIAGLSTIPNSKSTIDSNSTLADQVWAAGHDIDIDNFEMPTMSQLSASFDFGELYRDTSNDQLVADVTIRFDLADSEFILNTRALDFEHMCDGLLGVESHRCNFRSLCGMLVTCPSTLLKTTCSNAITVLQKGTRVDDFSLVLGTLLLNTRAVRSMENVATPSQAGTMEWLEYLFADDLGDRCVLRIRLFETHVDADCYYLGTQAIDTTLPAVVLISYKGHMYGSDCMEFSFADLVDRQSDIHQGMDIRFIACAKFEDTMNGVLPTFDHGIDWIKHRNNPSCGKFSPGDRPTRSTDESTGMLHMDEESSPMRWSDFAIQSPPASSSAHEQEAATNTSSSNSTSDTATPSTSCSLPSDHSQHCRHLQRRFNPGNIQQTTPPRTALDNTTCSNCDTQEASESTMEQSPAGKTDPQPAALVHRFPARARKPTLPFAHEFAADITRVQTRTIMQLPSPDRDLELHGAYSSSDSRASIDLASESGDDPDPTQPLITSEFQACSQPCFESTPILSTLHTDLEQNSPSTQSQLLAADLHRGFNLISCTCHSECTHSCLPGMWHCHCNTCYSNSLGLLCLSGSGEGVQIGVSLPATASAVARDPQTPDLRALNTVVVDCGLVIDNEGARASSRSNNNIASEPIHETPLQPRNLSSTEGINHADLVRATSQPSHLPDAELFLHHATAHKPLPLSLTAQYLKAAPLHLLCSLADQQLTAQQKAKQSAFDSLIQLSLLPDDIAFASGNDIDLAGWVDELSHLLSNQIRTNFRLACQQRGVILSLVHPKWSIAISSSNCLQCPVATAFVPLFPSWPTDLQATIIGHAISDIIDSTIGLIVGRASDMWWNRTVSDLCEAADKHCFVQLLYGPWKYYSCWLDRPDGSTMRRGDMTVHDFWTQYSHSSNRQRCNTVMVAISLLADREARLAMCKAQAQVLDILATHSVFHSALSSVPVCTNWMCTSKSFRKGALCPMCSLRAAVQLSWINEPTSCHLLIPSSYLPENSGGALVSGLLTSSPPRGQKLDETGVKYASSTTPYSGSGNYYAPLLDEQVDTPTRYSSAEASAWGHTMQTSSTLNPSAPAFTPRHTVISVLDSPLFNSMRRVLVTREYLWSIIMEEFHNDDDSQGMDLTWRARYQEALHDFRVACIAHSPTPSDKARPISYVVATFREHHKGRVNMDSNPARVAMHLQPLVTSKQLSQEHVDFLVQTHTSGLRIEEMRPLTGSAVIMENSKTAAPRAFVVKDFNFAQAARGRVMYFGKQCTPWLDLQPELVASPVAVVDKPGAAGRCINNLSASPDPDIYDMFTSVNDGPAYPDETEKRGSTTPPSHAFTILQRIIYLLMFPFDFPAESWLKNLRTALVDLKSAYYRVGSHAEAAGLQSIRLLDEWIVALCMVFGARRSGEMYPLITTAILELHHSLSPRNAAESGTAKFCSSGHTDDFSIIEVNAGQRLRESFAAMIFAAKVNAGHDAPAAKKLVKNGFFSGVHKFIGCIDDILDLTFNWPRKKQIETAELILSDAFNCDNPLYPALSTMKVIGNLRWCGGGTLLPLAGLYRMTGQAGVKASDNYMIRAVPMPGETQKAADTKVAQDIHILRSGMKLIIDNPSIAKVSMLSCLNWQQRLRLPGQCFKVVWVFGDASFWGFAWGIEYMVDGALHRFAMQLEHTAEFRSLLLECANGNNSAWTVDKPPACINVAELGWICMAEEEFAETMTCCLTISLPDNKNCTHWITKGYAKQPMAQAMLLRMTKRRWLAENPHLSVHLPRENNQLFDHLSKGPQAMDNFHGLNNSLGTPFKLLPATNRSIKIQHFLPKALLADQPCAVEFDDALCQVVTKTSSATHKLHEVAVVSNLPDWRHRIAAASLIHADPLFIFNDEMITSAYRNQLLLDDATGSINTEMTFRQLQMANRDGDRTKYTWTDGFHGGGGSSIAIISAGMTVTQGWDIRPSAVKLWQQLTGACSLGNVYCLNYNRLQQTDGATFSTMCAPHSNAMKHCKGGLRGLDHPGGFMFTKMFTLAAACGAKFVTFEQVGSVMFSDAFALMQKDALDNGYVDPYIELVPMAFFGAEDGCVRLMGVSHLDSITLPTPFAFPKRITATADQRCVIGEIMLCSTMVPDRFWNNKPMTPLPYSFNRGCINVVGKVGENSLEDQVQHPMGLIGKQLSSGNTRLILALRMKALCPLYSTLMRLLGRPIEAGRISCRWLTPCEDMAIYDWPDGTPIGSDRDCYSMTNAGVNITYFTRLQTQVRLKMEEAGISPGASINPNAYNTKLHPDHPDNMPVLDDQPTFNTTVFSASRRSAVPTFNRTGPASIETSPKTAQTHTHTFSLQAPTNDSTGMRSQFNADVCRVSTADFNYTASTYPKDRHALRGKPLCQFELDEMQECRTRLLTRFLKSQNEVDSVCKQWITHASRYSIDPILDPLDSPRTTAKFREAALDWALIEMGPRGIRGDSCSRKFWAVTKMHENLGLPNPFADDYRLNLLLSRARKLDPAPVGKMPCTLSLLDVMDSTLDLTTTEGFCVSAYHLNGLAYGNRVSEIAVGEAHTILWRDIEFSLNNQAIDVIHSALHPDEVTETLQSDKTTRFGNGLPRSHFLNPEDSWHCIVTRLCELKRRLAAVGMARPSDPVFSWSPGNGVTRRMSQKLLKRSAVLCGIPAGDVATHSLRAGAMSAAMAAGIPWQTAKNFLRWESDKSAELYAWPHTQAMKGRAATFFKSANLHATRRINGMGGVLQRQ